MKRPRQRRCPHLLACLQARFFSSFTEGAGHTQPNVFTNTLAQALDTLPGHCLDDEAAYGSLRWVVAALVGMQLLAGYTAAIALASKIVAASKQD